MDCEKKTQLVCYGVGEHDGGDAIKMCKNS